MIALRKYKSCDAQTIAKWLKNEYDFRQWSADRYESYPCMGENWNCIETEITYEQYFKI